MFKDIIRINNAIALTSNFDEKNNFNKKIQLLVSKDDTSIVELIKNNVANEYNNNKSLFNDVSLDQVMNEVLHNSRKYSDYFTMYANNYSDDLLLFNSNKEDIMRGTSHLELVNVAIQLNAYSYVDKEKNESVSRIRVHLIAVQMLQKQIKRSSLNTQLSAAQLKMLSL